MDNKEVWNEMVEVSKENIYLQIGNHKIILKYRV